MVVAIDPSLTSSGVAFGAKTPALRSWKPGKLRGPRRLEWFFNQTLDTIRTLKPAVVAIEGYAFSSRNSHAHGLGELGGVIRLATVMCAVPVLEVPPTKIKKFATGKGNANKQMVLTEAVRRLDYEGHSDDEADALWLWFLTQTWLKNGTPPRGKTLPATHIQALDGLKNGLTKP